MKTFPAKNKRLLKQKSKLAACLRNPLSDFSLRPTFEKKRGPYVQSNRTRAPELVAPHPAAALETLPVSLDQHRDSAAALCWNKHRQGETERGLGG